MDIKIEPRRRILVTGATGNQGGAVVRALLELDTQQDNFEVLALTRNTSSPKATLLARNPKVQLVSGDLNHVSDIFEQAGGLGSIWGVFSVQVMDGKNPWSDENKEYRQGTNLIDTSIKYGVQHFVQSSVDRGGDDSDETPTPIPHFITKHRIEKYLKERTKSDAMTYTILRPVAFMDMFTPDFNGRVFSALVKSLGDKPLQMVATKDIGIFAAQAFATPETDEYKNTAVSLAGDELNAKGCNEAFWKALHRPMPLAAEFFVPFIKLMVPEVGIMFQWFHDVGYRVDISKCRKLNSRMLDVPAYLKLESQFKR